MSTLLFGPTGIVGYAIARRCPDIVPILSTPNKKGIAHGWDVVVHECESDVRRICDRDIEAVIYVHAVCDVAMCEAREEWAREKNVLNLVRVLSHIPRGTRFVYLSSDHVFGHDGSYDERDEPCPISAYGRTRVEAEQRVLQRENTVVIRVPLAIGPSVDGRTGHLDWMRYRFTKGLPITIVEDEARSVLNAEDVVDRTLDYVTSDTVGLRHIAAPGVSRIQLADGVIKHLSMPVRYDLKTRSEQPAPHLGRVTLDTAYDDALAAPLPSALDRFDSTGEPAGNVPND